MFICEECLDKKYFRPFMALRSRGPCEVCGIGAVCYDIPSKYLGALLKTFPMGEMITYRETYEFADIDIT